MPKTKTPVSTRCYKAASYARLSVEDDGAGTSSSVLNQHTMIHDFAEPREDLRIVDEYSDDGCSGSTFENRPGWAKLLVDIDAGKVDCVIVKDLSRMGRNYLDVSRYLDQLFPAAGVRVIAITDGYDSKNKRSTADSLMLPVKNLFNDMYCRDASAKTKASLSAKRRRGEFVGSFAPYGYEKSLVAGVGRLVVDPDAAGIVRDIFDARLGGMSAAGIADMLNERHVPTPYEYFQSKGSQRSSNFCRGEKTSWGARTVIRILSNEMYAGTLVQGKTRKPDFRRKEVMAVDESEWSRKEGAHEAIIDRNTYDLVQKLAGRDMRLSPGTRCSLPLSGFVFCADCGSTMARHSSRCSGGKRFYYSCEAHRKDKDECSMHKIWEDDLLEAVVETVRQCAFAVVSGSEAMRGSEAYRHDKRGVLVGRAKSADERLERNENLRLRMYSDYVDDVISKEQFSQLAKAVDERLASIKAEKVQIERELLELDDDRSETWEEVLARYDGVEDVERIMVVELIDKILVGEDNQVEVVLRFGDPFLPGNAEGEVE